MSPITGIFQADFTAFTTAVNAMQAEIKSLQDTATRGMQAMESSSKSTDDSQKQLLSTLKQVGGVLGVALSASAAAAFIGSVVEMGSEVDSLAKKSGLTTDALQALGIAGK